MLAEVSAKFQQKGIFIKVGNKFSLLFAQFKKSSYLCRVKKEMSLMRSSEISYFLSFCIEQYKQKHHLTGEQAMETLDHFGVLEYLERNYGVLHTQSWQWLVEEMDEFINEKKQ